MSLIGQTLGQYRIVEFIGAGGMASVYKAYQPSLDRHVAIKVLPAQHALTPGYKDRFTLEAKAVAQLSHPNILPIYDFGLKGDLSYFVMKYVPDSTLADLMGQLLELERVGHFIDQLAGALAHAHAKGIVHRDIKPANMLLEGNWLLLTDFGLAKITEASSGLTSTGHIFGTPAYVSPEQAEGLPLDHRTDIYSLGVVMYEMIIGRVPFEGTTAIRIINKHIHELPPTPRSLRPDLAPAVEQVMLKAIAKKPEERYAHALELAAALREAIQISAAPLASTKSKRRTHNPAASGVREKESLAQGGAAAQVSPPATHRPRFYLGLSLLALVVVLVLAGGAFLFFAPSANTTASTPTPAASSQATRIVAGLPATPTSSPTTTPVPPTATRPATKPAVTATATLIVQPVISPTPVASPSFAGTLAIPVKVGAEFKVYLTGLDGAGFNGPAPVSLGHARQPMFRRDGQAIVVKGTEAGALQGIFITTGQGSGPTPLNEWSNAFWPVWSPTGREIVVVDLDRGRRLFRRNIQPVQSEADYTQVQANNISLAGNNLLWSDDNQLIFQGCADWLGQSGECGIWATDATVIEPVRLTTNGGLPTDAKNGLLTYMLANDGDWEIYLLPLAGGQSLNLTDNSYQDGLAALAPDGQSVAYLSNESGSWAIWTITLSDNKKQKWFDLDPQRGTIDVNSWSEERMSWTE